MQCNKLCNIACNSNSMVISQYVTLKIPDLRRNMSGKLNKVVMFVQHSTYPWPLVITWPGDATGQHRLSHSLSLAQCESCLSFHLCPDRFGNCLTDSTLPCAVSHNLTVWSLHPDTNKCPLAAFVLSCSGPEKFQSSHYIEKLALDT